MSQDAGDADVIEDVRTVGLDALRHDVVDTSFVVDNTSARRSATVCSSPIWAVPTTCRGRGCMSHELQVGMTASTTAR